MNALNLKNHDLLCVHHVGARGSTQVLPPLPIFDTEFVNILYDADTSCVEEIRANHSQSKARTVVYPFCLAGASGERYFHNSESGYNSSLLPPDPFFVDCYTPFSDLDYVLKEGFATRSIEKLMTHSLDDLIDSGQVEFSPDLLSLDTEGAELEILRGAERALDGVVCVISEVEFLPLYQDQPLFGEIARYLLSRGFLFAGFNKSVDVAFTRLPLGSRGRRFPAACDGIFLRDPRSVSGLQNGSIDKNRLLRKLAFVSIVMGFIEHGRFALEIEAKLIQRYEAQPKMMKWMEFLAKFEETVSAGNCIFPQTFFEKRDKVFGALTEEPRSVESLWPPLASICSAMDRSADALLWRSE